MIDILLLFGKTIVCIVSIDTFCAHMERIREFLEIYPTESRLYQFSDQWIFVTCRQPVAGSSFFNLKGVWTGYIIIYLSIQFHFINPIHFTYNLYVPENTMEMVSIY